MSWTAIIPFKGIAARKTRLANILSPEQRLRFSQRMFEHVRDVILGCANLAEVGLLSDVRVAGWSKLFFQDEGRGLNAELAALVRARPARRLLVIHADLPLLDAADVSVLLEEADKSALAIAPDRSGTGTNALALVDPSRFEFQFGAGSLQRHVDEGEGRASIVRRTGLSFDIDTPDDYLEACRIAPDTIKHLML